MAVRYFLTVRRAESFGVIGFVLVSDIGLTENPAQIWHLSLTFLRTIGHKIASLPWRLVPFPNVHMCVALRVSVCVSSFLSEDWNFVSPPILDIHVCSMPMSVGVSLCLFGCVYVLLRFERIQPAETKDQDTSASVQDTSSCSLPVPDPSRRALCVPFSWRLQTRTDVPLARQRWTCTG